MGRFSKGLKAGLAAGIIYAGLVAITFFLFFFIFRDTEISNLRAVYPSNATQVYQIVLVSGSTSTGITGLLVGVVFGIIFGFTYSFLLGKTSVQKGVFLGIFLFLFNLFVVGVSYVANTAAYFAVVAALVSLGSTAAYGFILGHFYDRFEKTRFPDAEALPKPS